MSLSASSYSEAYGHALLQASAERISVKGNVAAGLQADLGHFDTKQARDNNEICKRRSMALPHPDPQPLRAGSAPSTSGAARRQSGGGSRAARPAAATRSARRRRSSRSSRRQDARRLPPRARPRHPQAPQAQQLSESVLVSVVQSSLVTCFEFFESSTGWPPNCEIAQFFLWEHHPANLAWTAGPVTASNHFQAPSALKLPPPSVWPGFP